MTYDEALCVQLLRRGEVILLRVYEVASLEVLDRHLDGEGGVGRDLAVVGGEHELRRGHDCFGGDRAHGCRVA